MDEPQSQDLNPTLQNQEQSQTENSIPQDNNSNKNSVWVMVLILVLIFMVGAIFIYVLMTRPQNVETDTSMPNVDVITERGSLIVGFDATFAPMESLNSDGEIIGFDVDLATKMAESFGVELEAKNIEWDLIFDALLDGEIDLIISSVTITDERKETYAFSEQYINAGQVILTQKTNTTITSVADLVNATIAVQEGTTNEDEALKYTSADNVLKYPDFDTATEALVNGEADAIFSDLTYAKDIIDNNPTIKIASEPFTNDFYGVVMRQGEDDVLEKVNGVINELKQTGYLLYLHQKWLE